MTILATIVLVFASIRMCVALINWLTKSQLPSTYAEYREMISILIPARNEEKNLPELLYSLKNQHYKNFEVIVYDDESTDGSLRIIKEFAGNDSRFRYIEGKPLPNAWLGKNHACHQLALAANGSLLLFLDADLKTGNQLINQSVTYFKSHKMDLLSIFPVQLMQSFGEKITVPVMNWILLSLLPMFLIKSSKRKSLSAANGQFMLFDASVYNDNMFHKLMKTDKVEDIHIARYMKSKGYRVNTLLGNSEVKCRMYSGFAEAIYGFSKNVIAYFGDNYLLAIFFMLITGLGWLSFIFASLTVYLGLYLIVLVLTRVFVSAASKQNILRNIITMPVQQISFTMMVIQSIQNRIKMNYKWKERNIITK